MKFLLDVHVGTVISRALVAGGHDVLRAAIEYPTSADAELLALAVEEGRTIITQDSDFTDLIFAFSAAPPPALIYLRCDPMDQHEMVMRILEILESDMLNGHIAVLTPSTTRFRPFPPTGNDNG